MYSGLKDVYIIFNVIRDLLQPVHGMVIDINNKWNKTGLFEISYYNKVIENKFGYKPRFQQLQRLLQMLNS
jgi:hypothetical protein